MAEKACDTTPFYEKTLNKVVIEGNYFSLVNFIYEKSIAKDKLNSEMVKDWKLSS